MFRLFREQHLKLPCPRGRCSLVAQPIFSDTWRCKMKIVTRKVPVRWQENIHDYGILSGRIHSQLVFSQFNILLIVGMEHREVPTAAILTIEWFRHTVHIQSSFFFRVSTNIVQYSGEVSEKNYIRNDGEKLENFQTVLLISFFNTFNACSLNASFLNRNIILMEV